MSGKFLRALINLLAIRARTLEGWTIRNDFMAALLADRVSFVSKQDFESLPFNAIWAASFVHDRNLRMALARGGLLGTSFGYHVSQPAVLGKTAHRAV